MIVSPIHERVAALCADRDLPVTATAIAEIDEMLADQRAGQAQPGKLSNALHPQGNSDVRP